MFSIKKRFKILECILLATVLVMAGSNEKIIKSYQSKEIGKGVYLNQIFSDMDSKGVYRGFRITVQNDDNYFISSWIQGLMGTTLDVLLDEQSVSAGKVSLAKHGWQAGSIIGTSVNAAPTTIHLSKGDHTISFRGKGPGVPDVEYIQTGRTEEEAFISDTGFQKKLLAIKAYAANHAVQTKDDTSDVSKMAGGVQAAASAPSDPLYDYTAMLGQPFSPIRIEGHFTCIKELQ